LKTGHTDAAGYCMVATAKRDIPSLGTSGAAAGTPAAAGSRRLLSIILGADSENSRANESQKLLNWGYTAFEPVKLFDANQAVVTPNVWKGASSSVKLGRFQAVVVAVPAGMAAKLKTEVIRNDPLIAPIAKGQVGGTLRVTSGEQTVVDVPLVALEGVEQAGILGRAWDAMRLWIR
jgi:D-alanyl-D-alanine carboxypeptidase (penicillin-binding protein 5/6)